ncbi:Putative lumenal protein, contains 8 pentapeptide repeats, sll0301-like protein [Nodularia spumigena CCY9414]|nr:Putative lumenal protein, contains 8 pentapeptide repeats, sll0301-like protein [Nodularia spumigena CCY9414]EAW46547.1 hypothetical protein N9414_21581 [Nodularia spumigena CCY9414]
MVIGHWSLVIGHRQSLMLLADKYSRDYQPNNAQLDQEMVLNYWLMMINKVCQVMKKFLLRLLSLLVIVVLAGLWVIINPQPAFAQINTINYSNASLQNRDFSNTDLAGGTFVAAEMRGANFQGANLKNAILTKGVLLNANLENANLEGALVDRVTMDGANLKNAIFTEATMTRSRFFDADITGADFTDALIDRYQVALMCDRAAGINSVTGVATRDSLGCR